MLLPANMQKELVGFIPATFITEVIMQEFFTSLTIQDWLLVLTGAVTVASAIATVTPNKTDDKIVKGINTIIDIFALNVGRAKNEKS